MSIVLQRLSDSNKKAIVSLACMIEAQGKGGRFRSNDPEVDIIIRECFDDSWRGNWDNDYKHNYFGQAVLYAINNQRECFQIVAALDDETKYAFKNMMIDIIGDNAMMVLAAAYVYKEIGMPTYVAPQREESVRQERNEQEEGDASNIEDPFYILINVGAVRGENDKVFTLVNPYEIKPQKYNLKKRFWGYSIYCDGSLGPVFGCYDIKIEDNCNIKENKFTFYEFKKDEISFNDTTGKKRLLFTGKDSFIVKEIEVFQIIR